MARLFTREDPKRMHATTGALALLSFFYRLVLFARHGTSFPTWEPLPLALATVAIHGMLHVTSFIPHVSKARVMGKPMIWPEFRLHSAVFGLRHVFATALWLAARRYDLPAFTTAAVAAALVHGASIAAAWVTDKSGCGANSPTCPSRSANSPRTQLANSRDGRGAAVAEALASRPRPR